MSIPEIEYDVYNTPRIGAIEFGDFVAADGGERERVVRSSKYYRRAYRARAWYAKQEIEGYLSAATPKLGSLDSALDTAIKLAASADGGKAEDALASIDCLKQFIGYANKLPLSGKEIAAPTDGTKEISIEGLPVWFSLSAVVRSATKKGDKVGGIFLNTRQGLGVGSKPTTIEKRKKAGETVALIALRRVIESYSHFGEPHPSDSIHVYVRAQHHWCAPTYYSLRMKNIEADARTIQLMWDGVKPPEDFDPAKAKFHD
jgi:hypothetical protein